MTRSGAGIFAGVTAPRPPGALSPNLQPDLASCAPHRLDRERDVLIEIHAEFGGTLHDVVAAHVAREVHALHLLLHRSDLDLIERLPGRDERAGGEESAQL